MFDYAGAFHIHSSYSFDGADGMDEIVAAAARTALDFIVVTDHFRMDARADGWETRKNGVLIVVGEEISPRYSHYLALGIDKPIIYWKKNSRPQEYIDAVKAQGGIGLIAHPDHTGAPEFGVKAYPWIDWSVYDYDGMSVWDMMTDWQAKLRSLPRAIAAFVFPALMLSGPEPETLARWDRLWKQRKVAGYGEIDNHDTRKRMFGLTFRVFPFDVAFSTIRTHVLLDEELSDDAAQARQQIFGAIRACRLYIAQERWRKAKGFSLRVYGDDSTVGVGDDFHLHGNARLEVAVPAGGETRITLVRDGVAVAQSEAAQFSAEIRTKGIYRVEVRQKIYGRWRPWIYANPVRVC